MEDREELFFEIRAAREEGKPPKLVGYAAVFDKWSEDLGGFRERIASGAFSRTLKTSDVRAFYEHDHRYVLGREQAKTLLLREDERGLHMELRPPEAQWAKDLVASIDRGDIDKMSIGFRTVKDEWDMSDAKLIKRTLVDVDLFDVSIVSFPAYKGTSVALRRLEEFRNKGVSPLLAPVPPRQAAIAAEDGKKKIPESIKKALESINATPGF